MTFEENSIIVEFFRFNIEHNLLADDMDDIKITLEPAEDKIPSLRLYNDKRVKKLEFKNGKYKEVGDVDPDTSSYMARHYWSYERGEIMAEYNAVHGNRIDVKNYRTETQSFTEEESTKLESIGFSKS